MAVRLTNVTFVVNRQVVSHSDQASVRCTIAILTVPSSSMVPTGTEMSSATSKIRYIAILRISSPTTLLPPSHTPYCADEMYSDYMRRTISAESLSLTSCAPMAMQHCLRSTPCCKPLTFPQTLPSTHATTKLPQTSIASQPMNWGLSGCAQTV